jgi:peptide/nickel transport system permease protein
VNTKRHRLMLLCGVALLAPFVFAALAPGTLAPKDPTAFHEVAQIGARFVAPPFPVFQSAEFPLGSDGLGRDTLSRLIHAIRPTLLLTCGVALLRVLLGTAIGMTLGWSTRTPGRIAGWLLTAASAVPVLLVAFGVIAALQSAFGATAFLIGLSLTGWVDIAAFCDAQTRLIKQERFIEAARALGQTDWLIALRHGLRQLAPHLRAYLVIEAGAVLTALASLGLLGYFVNGSSWFMVTDFQAQRLSAQSDLPEMIASAVQTRNAAQMLISGSALVALILGFNLIGEALSGALARERRRRSVAYRAVSDFFQTRQDWLAETLAQRRARRNVLLASGALVLGAIAIALIGRLRDEPAPPLINVPGRHLWAGERRDPPGTLRTRTQLDAVSAPNARETKFAATLGGGPAVAGDGTLYIATNDNTLHALSRAFAPRWTAALPARPIGAPGLNTAGDIHVADELGGVTAFDAQGRQKWRYQPAQERRAAAGPVIDADGNLYLAHDGYLVSLDSSGVERWAAQTPYAVLSPVPRVEGRFVFFKDLVFSARTGRKLLAETADPVDQFVTGADGRLYRLSQSALFEWRADAESAALARLHSYSWSKRYPTGVPVDAGVWPDASSWLLLATGPRGMRLVWVDANGDVSGTVELSMTDGRVIGVSEAGMVYVCGEAGFSEARCAGVRRGADREAWTHSASLPSSESQSADLRLITGGALLPDALLVATRSGVLLMLAAP